MSIIDNDSPAFEGNKFGAPYAVEDDPNHLTIIFGWFIQLSAGQHECIHHAIAGEETTTSSF